MAQIERKFVGIPQALTPLDTDKVLRPLARRLAMARMIGGAGSDLWLCRTIVGLVRIKPISAARLFNLGQVISRHPCRLLWWVSAST